MSRYQITGIIYIHIYRHEWVTEMLYVRISTQNIACSQHQMNMERQRERKQQLLVLMTHEAKTTRCFRKTFYQHRHKGLFLKCPSLFDHFHPVAFCLSPLLGAWLHLRFSGPFTPTPISRLSMWYCIYIWSSRDKSELHSARACDIAFTFDGQGTNLSCTQHGSRVGHNAIVSHPLAAILSCGLKA